MLRWSGLLAAVATIVLLAVLFHGTRRHQVAGILTAHPYRATSSRLRITVPTRSVWPPNDWPPAQSSELVAEGIPGQWIGEDEDEKTEIATWTWEADAPEEITKTVLTGDEVVLTAMKMTVPGFEGEGPRYVRYDFRRGTRTWSIGRPSNGSFMLAYALAAGGPLLLWVLFCGVVLLCGLGRKSRTRD